MFVAQTTAGVLVQTYAQSDTSHTTLLAQTATDISSGAAACGGQTGTPRSCTAAFDAPSGDDTFVVTTYDAPPVNGAFSGAKQLAAANVNQTIVAGTQNTINVVLDGVLSSLLVEAPAQQIRGTAASSQNLVVEGLDADGNVIVTDAYADASGSPSPIALAVSPNTGSVFTLGSTSLSAPAAAGVPLTYNGSASSAFAATITATSGALQASASVNVLGPAVSQFTLPSVGQADHITNAPYSSQNTALWFTVPASKQFGSVSLTGTVTEYSSIGSGPTGIAAGPPGSAYLWITDNSSSQLEYHTTDGVPHGIFSTTTPSAGPRGIVAGPDGNMWFTEYLAAKIGKATTSGPIAEYATGVAGSTPYEITAGPDGNLWFTDPGANAIGKVTTSGTVTEYSVPTASSFPAGITAAPDGRLWFTENSGNKIGAVTTAGTFTEYPIPSANSHSGGIIAGADGNLWFLEDNGLKIARITPSGTVTEYTTGLSGSVTNLAVGYDNNLWITGALNKVAMFSW
jgi:virginiamycin B lyase